MKQESKQFHISRLFTLGVFFLFALTLVLVILTGAKIYRTTVDAGQHAYEERVTVQYLTARVRRADSLSLMTLEDFCSLDALVFHETLDGTDCQTLIYCYDGWLRELFCTDSAAFSPSSGEKVLPLDGISMTKNESLLHITATLPCGNTVSFDLQLRSGMEVTP